MAAMTLEQLEQHVEQGGTLNRSSQLILIAECKALASRVSHLERQLTEATKGQSTRDLMDLFRAPKMR